MRNICGENLSSRLFQRGVAQRGALSAVASIKRSSDIRRDLFSTLFQRAEKLFSRVIFRHVCKTDTPLNAVPNLDFFFSQRSDVLRNCIHPIFIPVLSCIFYIFVFMFYQKSADPEAFTAKIQKCTEVDVDHVCLRVPLSFCLKV